MSEIMFIKTSSLGDVIHNLPAVTDVWRHRPAARISWVVEEDYAPLIRLHPAVAEVIPVATRRWRWRLHRPAIWYEVRTLLHDLRSRPYDAVIDTQGLFRSALLSRLVRGRRHGFGQDSARETLATLFYDVHHSVTRRLHAIDRNRALTAQVLGYTFAETIDYGLAPVAKGDPWPRYAVFIHGSARREKEWREERWIMLGQALRSAGIAIRLPWGNAAERARSERLAVAIRDAEIPDRQPLDDMARLIGEATIVVGLDTGLTHLAAAFGVPLVAIFGGSDPNLTGPRGSGPITIVGNETRSPDADEVIRVVRDMLARNIAAPAASFGR